MSETTATKKIAAPAKAPAKKVAAPAKAPVKKAVPAKAPAKKTKRVIANFRTDYKADARVKVTRRSSDEPTPGRVTEVVKKKTGHFIGVNIGTKAAPNIIWARPSKVKAY